MKKFYDNPKVLLVVGLVLLVAGFANDGLWPWQLPACMLGAYMVTRSIINW